MVTNSYNLVTDYSTKGNGCQELYDEKMAVFVVNNHKKPENEKYYREITNCNRL